MNSIKNSFADCSACSLLDCPSCILETNSPKNIKDVEIIFISENPGKNEVEQEIPLIGRAGQIFRKPFNQFIKNNFKWLLTNTVLCVTLNPDGTTGNPDDETLHRCKENCFEIIRECNPKLIVLMGQTPVKAFGLGESGITKIIGEFFKWEDFNVMTTVHPSFVNRNKGYKNKFEESIQTAGEFLGAKFKVEDRKRGKELGSGVHYYDIPEKFYSKNYRLVDVQYLRRKQEVLYIFRDKDNNKIYHTENNDYVCYSIPDGVYPSMVMNFNDLKQIKIKYDQKNLLDVSKTYDGDIKLVIKHARDYYLKNKEEAQIIDMNIMYLDIEIYSESKEFPKPDEAKYPICMISYLYHGKSKTYLINPKKLIKNDKQVVEESEDIIVCKNEQTLIKEFISDLHKIDPDIISGWNVANFDLNYIINRCQNIGMISNSLSKFGEASVFMEGLENVVTIIGMTILDLYFSYRSFNQVKRENYKLGTIAQIELGEDKLDSGSNFSKMFREDINKAIQYNIRDNILPEKIEQKKRFLALQNELKVICKSSFKGSMSPFGQLDSLFVSYLKEKGLASKNADIHGKKDKFEGAYVKEPITGIHDYIVDFDFTSLYPSIIITHNIGINTFVMKFKDTSLAYELIYKPDSLPNKFIMIIDPVNKSKEVEVTKDYLFKEIKKNNLVYTISGCFFKAHDKELSYYNEILDMLLKSRKVYKDKMFEAKEESEKDLYNMRQLVYKVLANASYGVLGNNAFRFFNLDCARSITLTGQEAIKHTIIEANKYVEFIKDESKELVNVLSELTKQEMYGDMDRKTEHVITGDTDSLFICYKHLIDKNSQHIFDDIHKWNKRIQDYLNNEIVKKIVLSHNVPLERSRLELKNELIIKRGLFQAKKRYSLYVVENEGNKTDEIINMGLEIKRSDFPSMSKKYLSELLDLILKPEKISIIKINEFIKEVESLFLEKIIRGEKEIARPVSFKKKIKDYKVIPQGVRGMINWNSLEYNIFQVGNRGYLFKLNGIDLNIAPKEVGEKYDKEFLSKGIKLDKIVLPDEELRLPSYYIIDKTQMLDFSWIQRYTGLMSSIVEVKQKILTF